LRSCSSDDEGRRRSSGEWRRRVGKTTAPERKTTPERDTGVSMMTGKWWPLSARMAASWGSLFHL